MEHPDHPPLPDPALLPSSPTAVAAARCELRAASASLLARGLVAPAKWVGEQLRGLPPPANPPPPPARQEPDHPADAAAADALALAAALFAGREYRRAAHALRGAAGPRGVFLAAFSLYLAGEATRATARFERGAALGGSAGATTATGPGGCGVAGLLAAGGGVAGGPPPTAAAAADPGNPELAAVLARLEAAAAPPGPPSPAWDPFWLYLAGLVRADRGEAEGAAELLMASLRAFPLNWGAWTALAGLVGGGAVAGAGASPGGGGGDVASPVAAALADARLPAHWAVHFYAAHLANESHDASNALAALQPLGAAFPTSEWVGAAAAVAHYFARNFDEAEELFADAHDRDPHRLDDVDTHSNVLYVRDDGPGLAALARSAAATDKFSAPASIAAGNFFSLRGDHARAVAAFRRALALAPPPSSGSGVGGPGGGAWTLLGHEFVELQNPAAAVDAYRRAVDAAPGDYRAWYGLGQAYELLHLPHHALWYYRRAAALRPGDARMWVAVGQCCEGGALADDGGAAAAYRRALRAGDDAEASCLGRLARVHERLGDHEAAAAYHAAALAAADARAEVAGMGGGQAGDPAAPPPPLTPDAEDALLYLAAAAREAGDWATVEKHARRLAAAARGVEGDGGAAADAAHQLLADARRGFAAAAAGGGRVLLHAGSGRRRSSVGSGGRRRPSVGGASPGGGASPRW